MLLKFKYCLPIIFCYFLLTSCASNSGATTQENFAAADINVQLALAYQNRGDVETAKQKLLTAQQLAPSDPAVWYATGFFQEKTGDIALADQSYLRALKLAPHNGDAQNNYGTFLCRQKRYQESIQHFILAIQDPNYLATGEAYENAGLCALKIPNTTLAQQYFIQALNHNPQLPDSLFEMALLSYQQGNYQQAKNYLSRYKTLAPSNPQVMQLDKQLANH